MIQLRVLIMQDFLAILHSSILKLLFFSNTFYDPEPKKRLHMNRSIIGIIPARYDSKRFPGKLLATLLNKPVIQHTYENALKCDCLSDIYVATDDSRIARQVESFGGKVVMTSESCLNGTQRIVEAVKENSFFDQSTIFINIQGDHPFISNDTLHALVHQLEADPKAAMSTAVIPLTDPEMIRSPKIVKCVFDNKFNALYFSRSPIPYYKGEEGLYYHHLGVYCYRRNFLLAYDQMTHSRLEAAEDLEQLRLLENGFSIKVCVVDEMGHAIDTPEDLSNLELFLCP